MAKYPDEIVRNGLPFDFVSSHIAKIDAKMTVWELKDKSKENYWGFRSKKASIQTSTSNIGGVSSSYRHGTETKPRNMNVIWIMRIW